ncbi:MAG TPA: hypothetical protein VK993_14445 [Chthoniobacterales bacterium]|nr:hypothetical protein [Chthoniobacterales bacterium]
MAKFVPRDHPAKGVHIDRGRTTIVFLTLCTRHRSQRLANPANHKALLRAWQRADAWMIGSYVIMPDHLHLFCSPVRDEFTMEQWVTFWKRIFRRETGEDAPHFQSDCFHHRLRHDESYADKVAYVRANPVRAGLVASAEEWPFQGWLNEFRW